MCYDRKNKLRFLPKRTRTRTAEVGIEGGISDDENPKDVTTQLLQQHKENYA